MVKNDSHEIGLARGMMRMNWKLINDWRQYLISRKGIFITFIIFLTVAAILQIGVIKILNHSGEMIIDMRFSYSTTDVRETLESMGEHSRGIYSYLNGIDFIFPFTYMLFLFTAISVYLEKSLARETVVSKLALIPFIAGFFDLCENVCVSKILTDYPTLNDDTVNLSSTLTMAKWIFLSIAIGILVIASTIHIRPGRIFPINNDNCGNQ
jgi:hypothetical protein